MFEPKAPDLRIGKAYFLCGYFLRNLPIPEIETWIYVGVNILGKRPADEQDYHYFERPEVHFSAGMAEENSEYVSEDKQLDDTEAEPEPKMRVAESDLEALVYDYKGLVEWVSHLAEEPNAESAF